MAIENLFATNSNAETSSSRTLSGTAQLTNVANNIALQIINAMNNDIEKYADKLRNSQHDSSAMDMLIEEIAPLASHLEEVSFLNELSDDTINGMLKSQQSKRSRCKAKAMTMDNYKSLMVGSISENLIRLATGKEKNGVGNSRAAGSVDYTTEQLEQFEKDQEALRKEIRNVQSKKSIMKSKAGFSESDERWIALCRVEQQLKGLRTTNGGTRTVEVDTTKIAVKELLTDVDIEHLKAAECKQLLHKIADLVFDDEQIADEQIADEQDAE